VPWPVNYFTGQDALHTATALATNPLAYSTCAITGSQNVVCWGYNLHGQLGNGGTTDMMTPVEVSLTSGAGYLGGVTAIAVGQNHACAVASGNVYCWGYNSSGQIGTGTTGTTPVLASRAGSITGATQVSAGAGHSCALASGIVYCWGDDVYGELGNNSTTASASPRWRWLRSEVERGTSPAWLRSLPDNSRPAP
jgi:alpha-tubulin suppressor-like RCC1 family protein